MVDGRKKRLGPFGVRLTEEQRADLSRDAAVLGLTPHALAVARITGQPVTGKAKKKAEEARELFELADRKKNGEPEEELLRRRNEIMHPPPRGPT